jgi:hypothetical protein
MNAEKMEKSILILEGMCEALIGQVSALATVSHAIIATLATSQPIADELSMNIETYAKLLGADNRVQLGDACGDAYDKQISAIQDGLSALRGQ